MAFATFFQCCKKQANVAKKTYGLKPSQFVKLESKIIFNLTANREI